MSSELEFEIPSWDQIYELLLDLAEKIRRSGFKPDVIVGISRGGWFPARILSDLLENPELANIKVEFYLKVAETRDEPVITQPISMSVDGKKVLVVDDVADTGRSLALVRSYLKEQGATDIKIATIYLKPWSILVPDWYVRETRFWIVFPWERKEVIRNLVERCKEQGKPIEEVKEKLIRSGLDQKLVERFIREVSEE